MNNTVDFAALGNRIRSLRQDQSRHQFAEAFQVAPSSLARWEAGETQPDLSFLARLATAYEVDLGWLIGAARCGEPQRHTGREANISVTYQDELGSITSTVQITISGNMSHPEASAMLTAALKALESIRANVHQ